MGNEYEIRISTMDQALIEEHIQSLPYLKVFNAERNEFELKDSEGGFAYIGIRDGIVVFTDVQCNPKAAAMILHGLVDFALFRLGGRIEIQQA